jgi:hypothetical protein
VSALAASPGGGLLASVGEDGLVLVWDPRAGIAVAGVRVDGPLHSCVFVTPRQLAAGGARGLYLLTLHT